MEDILTIVHSVVENYFDKTCISKGKRYPMNVTHLKKQQKFGLQEKNILKNPTNIYFYLYPNAAVHFSQKITGKDLKAGKDFSMCYRKHAGIAK